MEMIIFGTHQEGKQKRENKRGKTKGAQAQCT